MIFFKKKIWGLFLIIFITSTIGFGFLIYIIKEYDYNEYTKKQENLTKITATSMNSIFLQYEMVLDILGKQLLKNKTYLDESYSKELLENLLELNPTLEAFALINKNGKIYISSNNLINVKLLPSLLDIKETRDSFLKTINSNLMVVGRTYFNKQLNTLIIPIRKAIRNNKGDVVAVMAAGIKVEKVFNLLSGTESRTVLIRDFDGYLQLLNYQNKKGLESFYKIQVPKNHFNNNIKKTEEKYNKSIEEIKSNESTFTINYKALMINKEVVASIKYLKRYELWVISQIEKNIIDTLIMKKILILTIIFLIVMTIFYFLFRNLNEYEQKKKNELLYQARHDHLTNLHNRLYLSDEFIKKKKLKPFTLFFIDLDNFKSINDNYGHNIGDIVLIRVSKRLMSLKKKNDSLVRYSGDEFLLITETIDKEKVSSLARYILTQLSEPYIVNQYKFIIGASIGISQYPKDGDSFDDVKRYADIAMYEAKKDKNSFHFFEDSIKHKYLRNTQIEQELKKAIINNEIYIVYQPQISKDGELFGVEALVRWENEKLGFISPEEFIKIAESTGHMIKLGKYIMKKSIKEIKDIQKLLNIFFNLSINISVKQFMDNDFYKSLLKYVNNNEFDKRYLTLEVTENVFIEDLDYILNLLNKIKEDKIKVSLDDFGTGYSSLSLLKKLPMEELKIDKSFVDDILVDNASKNMIKSMISIAKELDLEIVAEGIETSEQKEILDEYGCSIYQGYYFSRPLNKDALIEFIKNRA